VWFLLKVQFWPRVGYSLCSSTATLDELKNALHRQYYQILPLGEVVRTITVASRTIDAGFFGVGLPNLGIEALVATMNKLLMHYGCNMATGKLLQTSYSLFFVEAGLSFQPLQESHTQYGSLVTHSWVKILWEKLSAFDMKIVVADHTLKFPRENDKFIMQVLIDKGYTEDTLKRLNRVRVLQQVLVMSDILTASGCKIDKEAELQRHNGEQGLSLCWPNEQPTHSDFKLWRNALQMICPSRSRTMTVGKFIATTHRIWHWSWGENNSTLHRLHRNNTREDVFVSGQKPNRFHFLHTQQRKEHETVCLVEPTIDREHFRLTSVATIAMPAGLPSTFKEILMSWGNTWLWDHLTITKGDYWIHQAIAKGMLMAVTDGSYMPELYPNICSAAFVLECSKGQGCIYGAFSEATKVANAYRGKLLGLMAIHLILLSVNKLNRQRRGAWK
jgi:hypothetical protein